MTLSILYYVDPGAGSLLTQLILSIVIGAGFYLVALRKRIASFFRGDAKPDPSSLATDKTGTDKL